MNSLISTRPSTGATMPPSLWPRLVQAVKSWWRSWRGAHTEQIIFIACSRGTVWVTFQGDSTDYFVTAGESRCFKQQSRPVVLPLDPEEGAEYSINNSGF